VSPGRTTVADGARGATVVVTDDERLPPDDSTTGSSAVHERGAVDCGIDDVAGSAVGRRAEVAPMSAVGAPVAVGFLAGAVIGDVLPASSDARSSDPATTEGSRRTDDTPGPCVGRPSVDGPPVEATSTAIGRLGGDGLVRDGLVGDGLVGDGLVGDGPGVAARSGSGSTCAGECTAVLPRVATDGSGTSVDSTAVDESVAGARSATDAP
jgi:hypothetical protein